MNSPASATNPWVEGSPEHALWALAGGLRIADAGPAREAVEAAAEPVASVERHEPAMPAPARQATRPAARAELSPLPAPAGLAQQVAQAIGDGAVQHACPQGGLSLIRPDGRELWVSARALREMQRAGAISPAWAPVARIYQPSDADPLRDGLLRGYRAHNQTSLKPTATQAPGAAPRASTGAP